MLDLAIRGTLILVFAFAAAGVMRRASAAARHLLWASALTGLLVLPAVVRLGPAVQVPVPVLASTAALAPDAAPVVIAEAAPAAEPEVTVVRTRTHTRVRSREHVHRSTTPGAAPVYEAPSATAYIVAPDRVERRASVGVGQRVWDSRWAIWAAGVLLVLGRLLVGMARVRAIVREAVPVTDPEWLALLRRVARPLGVYRRVTLRVGPAGAVPVTCGILAPVIILPEDAEDWDDERRALVLTHELAHVRRLDVLTHIVGQCAVALFWFHPLAWVAAARMRLERERACDDLVLGSGARPSRYAGDLLDLVQTLNGPTAPAAARSSTLPCVAVRSARAGSRARSRSPPSAS
jgi:bla regulator protein BlaR1